MAERDLGRVSRRAVPSARFPLTPPPNVEALLSCSRATAAWPVGKSSFAFLVAYILMRACTATATGRRGCCFCPTARPVNDESGETIGHVQRAASSSRSHDTPLLLLLGAATRGPNVQASDFHLLIPPLSHSEAGLPGDTRAQQPQLAEGSRSCARPLFGTPVS